MDNRHFLIGIDLGTTSMKTVLFDEAGIIRDQVYREYSTYHPQPGFSEQNPYDWWNSVRESIRELVHKNKNLAKQVAAIGISSPASTVLPIDQNGNVLHRAIIWSDIRAEDQRRRILSDYKCLIKQSNPNQIYPFHCLSKILWFKENYPNIFNQTYKFLQSNGYIVYKLTGLFSMDFSQAGFLHIYNLKKRTWNEELCNKLNIPVDLFPRIYNCDEIVGCLTPEAALETGLSNNVFVIAGGIDTVTATLGSGIYGKQNALYYMGTGSNLIIPYGSINDNTIFDHRLIAFPYVLPDNFLLVAIMGSTGGSMKWLRKEFFKMKTVLSKKITISSYELLSQKAEKSCKGSNGLIFLPYLSGELSPIWNPNARGVIVGLSNNTNQKDLIRMIMEGCSYAVRQNLELMLKTTGKKVSEIIATGGPTQSDIWMQIVADVTNRPVSLFDPPCAASLGNAILAGKGVGWYRDCDYTAHSIVTRKRTFLPDYSNRGIYDHLYEIYCRIYEKIKEEFDFLSILK